MKTNGLTHFISGCLLILLLGCFNTMYASPINVNDIAPDISLPNKSEQTVNLSSLRGQLVLVHFWVSWDPTSRIINPNVGIIHNKYKNAQFQNAKGFEVLAVSLDSEKGKWLKAIQEDKLPGLHVNDFYSKYAAAYKIEKLPTSFLIDERGVIVGKNLSMAKLDKYLGQRAITYGVPTQNQPITSTTTIPPKVAPIRQPAITTTSVPKIVAVPKTAPVVAPIIDVTTSSPTNIIAPSPIATAVENKVNYKIQVGAYKTVIINKFKNIMPYGNLSTEKSTSGINRVLLGDFQAADKVATTLKSVQANGYQDAFVVVYNGTDRQRIISEAELVKQDNTPVFSTVAPAKVIAQKETTQPLTNVSNNAKPQVHVPISILATKLPPKSKITPTANEHSPEARKTYLNDAPTSAATYNYQPATTNTQSYPYNIQHQATPKPSTPGSLVPSEIAVFEPVTPTNYVQYAAPATHKVTWYPANQPAPASNVASQQVNMLDRPAATKRITSNSQERTILRSPNYASNPAIRTTTPTRSGATQRSKTYGTQRKSYTNSTAKRGTTQQTSIRPYSQPKSFSSKGKQVTTLRKPAPKTTKSQYGTVKTETDVDRNLSQMLDAYLEGYDYTTIGEDSSGRLKAKQKRLEKKRKKARKKRTKARQKKNRR